VRAGLAISVAVLSLFECGRREEAVAAPKIAFVNASPVAAAVGAPVRLTCSVEGTSTGVVSYRWSVSSPKRPAPDALDGIAVDWTAAAPGDYVATCTASNRAGTDMKSVSFAVETSDHREAPPAKIPTSPIAVRLKCEPARARGGEPVTCEVDFAGTSGTPRVTWTTSLGKLEGEGARATLVTPPETARGGQLTARVDVSVAADNGAAGTATASVLVDARPCDKTTLDAAPTVAFTREAKAADAGPPSDQAKKATPADGVAACGEQVASCVKQTGKIDACVKSVSRCQSPTPWRGDPGGVDCCPTACVDAYFARRREACASDLLETWLRDCYPGEPPR
jgi:hypothetical protein